ncbi:MAG: acyclic terpene utilization AtuA family protein, partial [Planctomycetota bacterium]
VAIIEGDDILSDLPRLIADGEEFRNMDTGEPLEPFVAQARSANVYIGAEPIVEALRQEADIVIAGRATDPSLVVAPLAFEFDWSFEDYDRLAAATVAGHIVECGAQCTGGNYVNWREVPDMAKIGYPVIEAHADGAFDVTKHAGTGGLVTRETVTSQLVYEMGDPRHYITPDCIADFTSIQLDEMGPDRVRVSQVKGTAPTDTYKVSVSYQDGYKIVGQLTVAGPDAVAKAELCAKIVFERAAMDGVEFAPEQRLVEIVGTNVCHAGIAAAPQEPAEVVLRIGAKGNDKAKLNRLGMEIVPLVTSGPPGVTGFAGGRPKATDIISYWPALMRKDKLQTKVTVEEI